MTQNTENDFREQASDDDRLLTADDWRTLAQSARTLSREIGLETLLQRILQVAAELTGSPEASVILQNERAPTLYFAAAVGPEADWVLSTFGEHSEQQVPIAGSKAGAVHTSGVSLVENVVRGHFSGVDAETKGATKSMVCVPLRVGDERLGVMQVLNKLDGDYSPRDRVLLEYFADQASVAIRNARLLDNLLAHSGLYGARRSTEQVFERLREVREDARSEILSVLFADMRGFTQLCQSLLDPALVQRRLGEFITLLSDSVLEQDGIVNKFLGDGVMSLFRGADCSERAVRCAFAMVRRFTEMKERWNDDSNQQLDFLDLGVGITTDQVILGGIGAGGVRDYTAIGAAVNLAAAFEASARDGRRILCDQRTFRNAAAVISDSPAPTDFLLQNPGQVAGVRYKCYHLESLQAERPERIFISYSHTDRPFVERLVGQLKAAGVAAWYSVADIQKGALWTAEIRKGIAQSTWVAVIVSKNSARSRWIRREVDLALTAEHLEDRIIPVAVDSTDLREVNEYLPTMQAIVGGSPDEIARQLAERVRSEG